MMVEGDSSNADSKWGEKKVEVEDSVRTVECLRGRLLAERVASRKAKEEADQWENKLIELENMLKQETRSRNRAEKKLRFLMKKLESLNIIAQISDESEHSGLVDKSDISSFSSSGVSFSSSSSSSAKEYSEQETTENQQQSEKIYICENQEAEDNVESQKDSKTFHQNGSLSSNHDGFTTCESSGSEVEENNSDNFEENIAKYTLCYTDDTHSEDFSRKDSKVDEENRENAYGSIENIDEEGLNQEDDRDHNDTHCNNSMAVVLVDNVPEETTKIDPEVLDITVREVLDTLKHAKESLQISMTRRRTNMIKVG